jgi:CRISPR-associated protein Cas2
MARRKYIVSYDIADSKRLRRVARVIEGFGSRIQYSVFECPLDSLRLQQLKARLKEEINRNHDQVLFIDLGTMSKVTPRIEAIGLAYKIRTQVTIV